MKDSVEEAKNAEKNTQKMYDLLEQQTDKIRNELEQANSKISRLQGQLELAKKMSDASADIDASLDMTSEVDLPIPTTVSTPPPPPPPSGGPRPPSAPPPPPKTSTQTNSSSSGNSPGMNLQDAIKGRSLKKVDKTQLENIKKDMKLPTDGLLGSLAQALLDRRVNMNEDDDEDDELLWGD